MTTTQERAVKEPLVADVFTPRGPTNPRLINLPLLIPKGALKKHEILQCERSSLISLLTVQSAR